jgi:hypothetical protein
MKYLKMLGLAAVAAMALMAFLGASSASATVLCTATETPCTGTHLITPTNDKWLHAVLEKLNPEEPSAAAYLLSTSGAGSTTAEPLVKCTESTVTAESEETGDATHTAKGLVTSLTFGGCEGTTVDVLAAGTLEVHHIANTDNGTVTSKNAEVTVNIGVSCTYGSGAGTDIGTLTGGPMATMDISAVVNKVAGSFLCPSTAIWEAKYTVTEPEPLYVEPS